MRAKGLVGANALPTLTRAAKGTFQKVVLPGSQKLQEFNVLDDVSGVIKPARMTLLLGPPNSGKSTFLKLLAGRLEESKSLKVSGDVKYNGKPPSAFVLERTAAYIDQEDNHVRRLIIHVCQIGLPYGLLRDVVQYVFPVKLTNMRRILTKEITTCASACSHVQLALLNVDLNIQHFLHFF